MSKILNNFFNKVKEEAYKMLSDKDKVGLFNCLDEDLENLPTWESEPLNIKVVLDYNEDTALRELATDTNGECFSMSIEYDKSNIEVENYLKSNKYQMFTFLESALNIYLKRNTPPKELDTVIYTTDILRWSKVNSFIFGVYANQLKTI